MSSCPRAELVSFTVPSFLSDPFWEIKVHVLSSYTRRDLAEKEACMFFGPCMTGTHYIRLKNVSLVTCFRWCACFLNLRILMRRSMSCFSSLCLKFTEREGMLWSKRSSHYNMSVRLSLRLECMITEMYDFALASPDAYILEENPRPCSLCLFSVLKTPHRDAMWLLGTLISLEKLHLSLQKRESRQDMSVSSPPAS